MSQPPRQPRLDLRTQGEADRVAGVIQRVTFHSEESGFCVLRLKLPGRRELATVVGRAPRVTPGEFAEARGEWVTDPNHGSQFKASELRVSAPTTREGMERYLGSGMVHGIGPGLAKRLVAAFGEQVFDVIEHEPDRLREVPGVGDVRTGRIVEAWVEQKKVREIMVFLYTHGVGTARAVRIFRAYGQAAIDRIREDPYCLARDIRGIGFVTSDELAQSLGVAKTAPARLRAGLRHVLGEAVGAGNCGLPEGELLGAAQRLLDVEVPAIESALEDEVASRDIVRDEARGVPCAFLAGLYGAERAAARRLLDLALGRPPWLGIEPDRALPWAEARLGISLADSQREALRVALDAKLLILTGGPGVGKTTLVRALLDVLEAKEVRVALAAPTGRAAKRLAASTGREARTLHRLLETNPATGGFKRGLDNPLECDLLVVDETSMVDVPLLFALVKAVPQHAGLLLIGDVDQLPSVGPGQVLRDAIDSGVLPVVRLREVFRQAAQSRIVQAAHRVNQGEMPDLEPAPDSDFYFVEADEPEAAAARILSVVRDRIPARFGLDPVRDVQVLCPMHRGRVGAQTLNAELQSALNPPDRAAGRVERYGVTYATGDKVMQTENDYDKDVFNGDLGFVGAIDDEARRLVIDFEGREVEYGYDEVDALALAYATTVHKAQGSEYPAVVLPILTQHYAMLKRNLLYTAITRGRQLVVVVGQRRALQIAVKGAGDAARWSKLRDWLVERGGVGEF